MRYQISLKKRVIKALEKIDEPFYAKIKESIYNLAKNPRPSGYIKLKGRNGYRIRVGDYRIIYEIFDGALLIDVIELGNRKNVYE